MVHFRIPAVPVAQPRPRATAINGKARVFEAGKTHAIHAFKASARLAAQQVYSGAPLDCPLRASMIFVFPRPKSMQWKSKPMPRVPHAKKPDADNLAKSVLDSLNGLLFVDDSQVYDVTCMKFIASGVEQPHVEVRFDEVRI